MNINWPNVVCGEVKKNYGQERAGIVIEYLLCFPHQYVILYILMDSGIESYCHKVDD